LSFQVGNGFCLQMIERSSLLSLATLTVRRRQLSACSIDIPRSLSSPVTASTLFTIHHSRIPRALDPRLLALRPWTVDFGISTHHSASRLPVPVRQTGLCKGHSVPYGSLVMPSNFGLHGTDAGCKARPEVKENSPRRARRMECDELSNRIIEGAVADLHEAGGGRDRTPDQLQCHLGGVVNRTGYYTPQVFFVPACPSDADRSFVVNQSLNHPISRSFNR
jgi:hypothetical protein